MRITIEDNGHIAVYEGTVTDLSVESDVLTHQTIEQAQAQNLRTGSGRVSVSMRFTNGPVDRHGDNSMEPTNDT